MSKSKFSLDSLDGDCDDCKFFFNPRGYFVGECRLNPPVPILIDGKMEFVYPHVAKSACCGNFVQKGGYCEE